MAEITVSGDKDTRQKRVCVHFGAVAWCGRRTWTLKLNLTEFKAPTIPSCEIWQNALLLLFVIYIYLFIFIADIVSKYLLSLYYVPDSGLSAGAAAETRQRDFASAKLQRGGELNSYLTRDITITIARTLIRSQQ